VDESYLGKSPQEVPKGGAGRSQILLTGVQVAVKLPCLLFQVLEQGISIGLVVVVWLGLITSRPWGGQGLESVRVGQEIELLAKLLASETSPFLTPFPAPVSLLASFPSL
jgi:hypothetical protein